MRISPPRSTVTVLLAALALAAAACESAASGDVATEAGGELTVDKLGCAPEALRGLGPIHELAWDASARRLELTLYNVAGGACDNALLGGFSFRALTHELIVHYGITGDRLSCRRRAHADCGGDYHTKVRLTLEDPLERLPADAFLLATEGIVAPDFLHMLVNLRPFATDRDQREVVLPVRQVLSVQQDAEGGLARAVVDTRLPGPEACVTVEPLLTGSDEDDAARAVVVPLAVAVDCPATPADAEITLEVPLAPAPGAPDELVARTPDGAGFASLPLE